MRIAIIGAGNVGRALAQGFARTPHAVTLGARDAARVADFARDVGAETASPDEAARDADIIILALPWDAAQAAISGLGDLSGKVVVDCTNPLGMVDGALGLVLGHATSGGEMVAGWSPGARVVKTLNQVGAEMMAAARELPHRPVMFMAGDDDAAKTQVAEMLGDLGFEPLDAGPLARARLLEPLAMVWINQAIAQGMGRDWAFAAVRRTAGAA